MNKQALLDRIDNLQEELYLITKSGKAISGETFSKWHNDLEDMKTEL